MEFIVALFVLFVIFGIPLLVIGVELLNDYIDRVVCFVRSDFGHKVYGFMHKCEYHDWYIG